MLFNLFWTNIPLQAQQYYFHNYTGDDGLSQLVAQTIFQDRDGYIWVGTQAGLNRYDGHLFEIFNIRDGLPNDWINTITQDSTGKIWIGTNGGLSSWDGDGFVNYGTKDGLINRYVLSLAVDSDGNIWCGTAAGLCRWDGSKFEPFDQATGIPLSAINALFFDHHNRLWVGADLGLFYLQKGKFHGFQHEDIKGEKVFNVFEDGKHRLWTTLKESLLVFDDAKIVDRYGEKEGLSNLPESAPFVMQNGDVWVGTTQGVWILHDDEVQFLTTKNGLAFEDVRAIIQDREGIIWLGGFGGVAKFLGSAFATFTQADGLGSSNVRPILRDRKGMLWVGTLDGLSRFDGSAWQNVTKEDGLNENQVLSLLEDRQGRLWMGTNRGLNYFDGQRFHDSAVLKIPRRVVSLVEDHSGTIWCAVQNVGLFVKRQRLFEAVQVSGQAFSNPRLLVDQKGNVWAGGDHGLSKWNGSSWHTYTVADGLADNEPYFLCEDRRGNIWFGYHSSRGVTCFDGKEFKTYTSVDGLTNEAVYSLGVDYENNLWIGTARGVDRFDGKTFINYGTAEGYASQESNSGGFFADVDSTLWFGTAEGLSHYFPSQDLVSKTPPQFKIHQLTFGHKKTELDSTAVVEYSKNDFHARIAPLSYINPKHLKFRYRLVGYENDWTILDAYKINYMNLPPGQFTLEVQGRKYRQAWSESETVSFTIQPPFWRTWWFGFLAIVCIGALIGGFYRYRTYQINARNRWLKQVVADRTSQLEQQKSRLERILVEQKKSEEALRESQERLHTVITAAPVVLWSLNSEGTVTFLEGQGLKALGIEPRSVIGKSVFQLHPGLPYLLDDARRALSGESFASTIEFKGFVFEARHSPIYDQDGNITGSIGVAIDITERNRAEADKQKFVSLVEYSNDFIAMATLEGKLLYINQAGRELVGLAEHEIRQKCIVDFHFEDSWQQMQDEIIPNVMKNGFWEGESQLRHFHSHSRIDVHKSLFLVRHPVTKEPLCLATVQRDISERKRAELELKKAKEGAVAANLAKSEFLANMSHEIRTPLNVIIGMTDLALETELDSEQKAFLNVVQTSSEGLLNLINDILDFSKIEAGQMEIEAVPFNLREVVEGAAEIFSIRCEAKNIELLCYVEPDIPNWVIGDPTRLRQILVNLCSNAIKFTEEGEVAIKVELSRSLRNGREEVELHFMVTDTGVGIAPENVHKIFEKFSQEDSSTTRRFGGTGLGLNITKSLLELMDGKLWVESERGVGSIFQFKLNLTVAEEQAELKHPQPDLNGVTVLVVDDNETNRFILRKTITAWGLNIKEAQTGPQALSILRTSSTPIELIIMDQQMPEMNGIELAQKIREDKNLQDVKIIMLSSVGGIESELRKKLGLSFYITKPVKQSKLFDLVTKALSASYSEELVSTKPKEQRNRNIFRKILLVEDNVDNQNLAQNILKKAGYLIDVAENGEQGVNAAKRFQYDLIIMDIQMPVMDGFEATKKIRQQERENKRPRVPIIALTAHALKGYREKCIQYEMDDFVTKPIRKQVLLKIISKWIDLRPTILVVEDLVDSQKLMRNHLQKGMACKLLFAQHGKEALELYQRQSISLIFMDMEMPVMNGYEAASAIRELEKDKEIKIPIVAMTAHQGTEEVNKCLESGCSSYLAKPIRKKELIAMVGKFLKPDEIEVEQSVMNTSETSPPVKT